jgi:hypothetical protein
MKTALLIAVSALSVAACSQSDKARTIARLDCPTTEGDLTRVSVSGDGKACIYRSAEGAEVSLELTALTGDVQATLDRVEAQLVGERAAAVGAAETTAPALASQDTAADAARARAEAAADAKAGAHSGGIGTIDADSETTRVDLPGIHITAKDEDANVQIGPLHVDASDDKATVKIFRNVRMKGEALSREKRGVRASFIYTGKDLPSGYRYIGYQAGGPKTGPLTIAKVRIKSGAESGDDIRHDVEELVRRNAGV